MIPRVVEEATGVDLVHHTVARVAGAARPLRVGAAGGASIRFLVADRAGCLAAIDGLAEARQVPGVVEVSPMRHPGQHVPLTHSFQDRLAYVIATAPGAAETGLQSLRATIS
jgi:biotin carboxylase